MAWNKHIYICGFLLTVIAGHAFLCTGGRQLKEINKQKSDHFKDEKGQGNRGKEPIGSKHSPLGHKGDLHVTWTLASHEISEAKESFPPTSRVSPNPNPGFGSSLTAYVNGFQPTTPGNSPGVGHSYVGGKAENKQNAPNSTSSVAHALESNPDDFRPTGPGRSPGVGHFYRSTNSEPNV
nr:precursor of CEP9-like [Coffea arabica]